MKALLVVTLAVVVAIGQVTVAPLFPMGAATFDFALLTLALFMVFAGPRTVMVAVPLTALLLGFTSGHSPALLLLAYLPLLPASAYVAGLQLPLSRYAQLLLVGTATGMFARLVLSLAAMAQGADFDLSGLAWQVLVPGLFLDACLLTIAYFPLRIVGWEPQRISLQRGGF